MPDMTDKTNNFLDHTNKPLVSILCITYNQEKYIAQTIESFLIQKTSFPFEIIIHDDASTDNTKKIISQYAKRYQAIIRPMYEKVNQYSKGNDKFINEMFRVAKGKYVAICEGDDYWTDPHKLQLQVDFLEKRPEYAICFHPVRVIFENDEEKKFTFPDTQNASVFTVAKLLKENFIQTNSVMYRRQNYDHMMDGVTPHDWYLHLYHAQFGKIGFINKTMSVYRRHAGGLWWDSHNNTDEFWKKYGLTYLEFFAALLAIYSKNESYKRRLYSQIFDMFTRLAQHDRKYNGGLLAKAAEQFPDYTQYYILELSKNLESRDMSLQKVEHEADELRQTLHHRNNEISTMKQSRVWRTRNIIARLVGKKIV